MSALFRSFRSMLISAIGAAHDAGYVYRNVVKATKPPRQNRQEKIALTAEQARHFIEIARGKNYYKPYTSQDEGQKYFSDENYPYMTYCLDIHDGYLTRKKDILPVKFADNIFEGHGFYVPADPDYFLKCYFGTNYMELPPPEQRKAHAREIKL